MTRSATVDLTALATMGRDELAERWEKAFGVPPPRGSRSVLLQSAIAWHLQMSQHVGSSDPARLLRSLKRSAVPASSPTLAPGTRLLRQWQGRNHHVTVLPSGFEHEGRRYRSLSAIC